MTDNIIEDEGFMITKDKLDEYFLNPDSIPNNIPNYDNLVNVSILDCYDKILNIITESNYILILKNILNLKDDEIDDNKIIFKIKTYLTSINYNSETSQKDILNILIKEIKQNIACLTYSTE